MASRFDSIYSVLACTASTSDALGFLYTAWESSFSHGAEFNRRDRVRPPGCEKATQARGLPRTFGFVASSADEVLGQLEVVAPAIFARSDESLS